LKEYDVNAIRIPLAIDSINLDPEISDDQVAGTKSLQGKTYLEILDIFISKCRERNMLVLLDNHRIEAAEPDFPDIAVPKDIIPALEVLADRYCKNPSAWNILGIDIKNEPKGTASWGTGEASSDWDLAAAEIGNAVLKKCKRWLIFIEGVQTNIQGVKISWGQAGGSLQGVKKFPVKLKNESKIVYSPHVLSPGVDFKAPWWNDKSFPENMPGIWDEYWGFIPMKTDNPVVVGAWGAKMKGKDEQWAQTLSKYLSENKIGSFYWAFNPQSADTGGLVEDDWKTAIPERFELLADLPFTPLDDILKKYGKCKERCKGNGVCVDGQCECYSGWSGPQCDVCVPGDTKACNNLGTCQKDGTCLCDEGNDGKYCGGKDCENITCGSSPNAGCVNGQCVCSYDCKETTCQTCSGNSTSDDLMSCDSCPNAESKAPNTHTSDVIFFLLPLIMTLTLFFIDFIQ
jgi:hypothetical protein